MESQGKFCNPQKISGASQQNNIAAFSLTTAIDVEGTKPKKNKKTKQKKTYVNNVFLNRFEISGHLETWLLYMSSMEPLYLCQLFDAVPLKNTRSAKYFWKESKVHHTGAP